MTINYDRLKAFPIPEKRQRLTRRDTVLYALSVGVGQNPVDVRQLDFVDLRKPLKAMPSMAVVLGHPGFWLADPATGVDTVRLVHGEQTVTLHGDLPVEGDVIGRTRVTGLFDRGSGRGALLYSEKEIVDAADGALLAVTSATTFLRGDGGFGGPSGPARPVAFSRNDSPDLTVDLETRPEQALYYRLNGDENPLHVDPVVAERAGFPRPILHGLCTFGVICHALLRGLADYDATRLRKMTLRFSSPVFPGETVRTEIWRDGSFRASVVERDRIVVTNGFAHISAEGGGDRP